MVDTHVPNEQSNQIILAGTELIPGDPAPATYRWTGQLTATENAALNRTEETTGGYDRLLTPRRSPSTFGGSYAEQLSYESFASLARYFMQAGNAGVSDGNTVPGYSHTKYPSFDLDDIASATLRYNVPGLGMIASGVRFNEVTITIDADQAEGAWSLGSDLWLRGIDELPGAESGILTGGTATTATVTGAAWVVNEFAGAYLFLEAGSHRGAVRMIVSNTVDTLTWITPVTGDDIPLAGDEFRVNGMFPDAIPLQQWETIQTAETEFYIDASADDIGTTLIPARLVSASITQSLNLTSKRFVDTPLNQVAARTGRGTRFITGSVRLEFDRLDEWLEYRNLKAVALRWQQRGSVIDPTAGTRKLARIDIPRAYWESPTDDVRDSNLTKTFGFVAYKDEIAPIWEVESINTLATLP